MSLTGRRASTVAATGVGRKDYSQSVEYSVEKVIRSLQERFFYSYTYTAIPTVAYPDVYESLLQFLVDGVLYNEAPSTKPWMFYLLEATTNTNSLTVITFNRYANYADYIAGTVAEYLGTAFGFVEAKLEFTKGVNAIAGSVYSIQYAVFSGADFDIDLVIHGLIGGQEEL